MPDEQSGEIVSKSGEQSGGTPDHRADDDDPFARVAIRQRSHERRCEHVAEEEGAAQESEVGIAPMKFRLDQWLHTEERGTIDIVEQVQAGQ